MILDFRSGVTLLVLLHLTLVRLTVPTDQDTTIAANTVQMFPHLSPDISRLRDVYQFSAVPQLRLTGLSVTILKNYKQLCFHIIILNQSVSNHKTNRRHSRG